MSVEPIPAAHSIAGVLSDLTMAWDKAIGDRASEPAPNSWAWFDQHDYPAHSRHGAQLVVAPSKLAFLTCSSVIQMARSIATLYANSNVWGLTLGHLPLLRSVLEGVGQIQWLITGDEPIDPPPASVSSQAALEASRARIARACLLWASCFQQAHRDFTAQREVPDAQAMKAQLAEWTTLTRKAFGTALHIRKKNDQWSINGVTLPGFGWMADRGFELAWWPNSPDNVSLYPWLSGASHHRLYALMSSLTPAEFSGRPVQQVAPLAIEVTAAGLVAGLAVLRMCDLTFAYLGWESQTHHDVQPILNAVHQLVQADYT